MCLRDVCFLRMNIGTIEAALGLLERDERCVVETNLAARTTALDFISFAEEFIRVNRRGADLTPLTHRLAALKERLTVINTELFRRLRTQIQEGQYTPASLRFEFDQYTDYSPEKKGMAHVGADALDTLLDGILDLHGYPEGIDPPYPDMVYYEPTPARAVLDMVDNVGLSRADVFYDLGSGLGRVAILFNLMSGVKAKGVEIVPTLCDSARRCASRLGLANVEFINADAREADYSDGAAFFMFTPFKGAIFQTVLDRLRQEGQRRLIKVCTYGACTQWAAEQSWLRSVDGNADDSFKAAIFHSD